MKKFWSLFNFEYNRLAKILFPGILIALGFQLFALVSQAMTYRGAVQNLMIANPAWSAVEVADQMGGSYSLYSLTSSPLFIFPLIGITSLFIFYAVFTWYRDWLGKNTFIYRLLMLPISRMNIYFSKLLVFVVGGMTALMTQFIAFYGFAKMAELIVTPEFIDRTPIYEYLTNWWLTSVFYPLNPWHWAGLFGISITFLSILFFIILAERSFRTKGVILGFVFFAIYLTTLIIASSSESFYSLFKFYLLPSEQLKLAIALHIFWLGLATFANRYLLEHQVSV